MYRILLVLMQWSTLTFCLSSSSTPQPTFTQANLSHEVVTLGDAADVALPLARNLIGLSIEFCYITSYLGDVNKPNSFSLRLLQNIQDLTGFSPRIRLGGDTQDVAQYCAACPQTLNNTFVPGNTEAVNVSFNHNLFTVLNDNVPSQQQYTFGLNLGGNDFQFPLEEFGAVEKYMNLSRLIAYELGNEPDFYNGHKTYRPAGWNVFSYATQSVDWLLQLTASLGSGNNKTSGFAGYMYGSMATSPASEGYFSVGTFIKLGIPDIVKQIKIFSLHSYFGNACSAASAAAASLPHLLNHANTLGVVSSYRPSIIGAHQSGSLFFMGETNSIACHGVAGISDTLGAALWMLDYSLSGAAAGMDGLFFHNGVSFFYSLWQPVALNGTAPHADGLYYGLLLFANLVSDLEDNIKVAPVPALDAFDLAHYAIFSSSSKLEKIVILNLDYIQANTARTYKQFDLSSTLGKNLKVKRLTGSSSTATTGLTFAGQTVDGQGNLSGALLVEQVSNGVVSVGSSEGVIIEMA